MDSVSSCITPSDNFFMCDKSPAKEDSNGPLQWTFLDFGGVLTTSTVTSSTLVIFFDSLST